MLKQTRLESIQTALVKHAVSYKKNSPQATETTVHPSRQPTCPCEGSCPRCSHDTDNYLQCEKEADQASAAIHTRPTIAIHHQTLQSTPVAASAAHQVDLPLTQDLRKTTTVREALIPNGSGKPLFPETKRYFESKFQQPFDQVRIHDNGQAAQMAGQQQADAYTCGHHIVFGQNQYAPQSVAGQRLLAHELAHVIQQRGRTMSSVAIQRRYTVKTAKQIVKQVNPQPIPPAVTFSRVVPALLQLPLWIISQLFNYPKWDARLMKSWQVEQLALGPFRAWFGKQTIIMDRRGNKQIKQPKQYLKNLIKVEEPFQRKTIIRHHRFIHQVLKSKPKSTWQDLSRYVFGFSKAPQQAIGAETRMFLAHSGRYAWRDWASIGEITPRTLNNPFYEWAALLHEQHHSVTAKQGFTNKAGQAVMDLKKSILQRPKQQFQTSDPTKIAEMKSNLRPLQDPVTVFGFIKNHPLLALDTRVLGKKIKSLYQSWVNYFSQTINYAKEELAAYCISWQAIRHAISFIRRALSKRNRP